MVNIKKAKAIVALAAISLLLLVVACKEAVQEDVPLEEPGDDTPDLEEEDLGDTPIEEEDDIPVEDEEEIEEEEDEE